MADRKSGVLIREVLIPSVVAAAVGVGGVWFSVTVTTAEQEVQLANIKGDIIELKAIMKAVVDNQIFINRLDAEMKALRNDYHKELEEMQNRQARMWERINSMEGRNG